MTSGLPVEAAKVKKQIYALPGLKRLLGNRVDAEMSLSLQQLAINTRKEYRYVAKRVGNPTMISWAQVQKTTWENILCNSKPEPIGSLVVKERCLTRMLATQFGKQYSRSLELHVPLCCTALHSYGALYFAVRTKSHRMPIE